MEIESNFEPAMGLTLRKENSSDEEANFRSGEASVSIPATETNSEVHR